MKYLDHLVVAFFNQPPFTWRDWLLLVCTVIAMIAYLWAIWSIDLAEKNYTQRRNKYRNLAGDPDDLTDDLKNVPYGQIVCGI